MPVSKAHFTKAHSRILVRRILLIVFVCLRSAGYDSRQSATTTPTSEAGPTMSVGPGFSGFEEKKKKTLKMGFFKKKLKQHSPSGRSKVSYLTLTFDPGMEPGITSVFYSTHYTSCFIVNSCFACHSPGFSGQFGWSPLLALCPAEGSRALPYQVP